MVQNFFNKFLESEKREAQDIREDIYSLIKKHFADIPDELVQTIYIDLVLVFFNIRPACLSFPIEFAEKVPQFVADLQMRIPVFGFIYDDILKETNMYPIIVFNKKHINMVKDSLKKLKKLTMFQSLKYASVLAAMLGYSCVSEDDPRYLQYRILFSFTYNPKSQMDRPRNIKTEHLLCWCRELDGFVLKNLVKKLERIETIFSVYGHIEPVNKEFMRPTYKPKIVRISEYNVNLEIDMKEEQQHSKILKY